MSVREVELAQLAHIAGREFPPNDERLQSVLAGFRDRLSGRGSGPPPIELYVGGGPPVLTDGNHRLTAARMLGLKSISAVFEVRVRHDRVNAVSAGMRRSNALMRGEITCEVPPVPPRPPSRPRLRYDPGPEWRQECIVKAGRP